MSELDWVSARAECSIDRVFQAIKLGIERDVTVRNSLLAERRSYCFGTEANNGNIVVFVKSNSPSA